MPFDAVTISALLEELRPTLTGARIEKISMPEKDTVVLSLRVPSGERRAFLLSFRQGSARFHFTEQTYENPPQPPMLCMLLRKHLAGGRITGCDQLEGDRVVTFTIEALDELRRLCRKRLVLELLGKGVEMLLLDEDGRIVECTRKTDLGTAARTLLPGVYYEYPQPPSKPPFFRQGTETLRLEIHGADRSRDPYGWLTERYSGLPPLLARELVMDGWDGLERRGSKLLDTVRRREFLPVLLKEDGAPKDLTFIRIAQYGAMVENVVCRDFNTLMEEFYSRRDAAENLRRRSAALVRAARTAADRLDRKIAAREGELAATKDRDRFRRSGDLILANLYRIRRGMESVEAEDLYAGDGSRIRIELDPMLTPQQNANAYYKRYRKAKTAAEVLGRLLEEAYAERDYLSSVLDELARAETDDDLQEVRNELTQLRYLRAGNAAAGRKKTKKQAPRRFIAPDGTEILAGRCNTQNDELTFRTASKNDLWLHVKGIPGSHVIVRTGGRTCSAQTLQFAADIAAECSGAAGKGRTAVDVTEVRNVKKPSGARPGAVLYTGQQTLLSSADRNEKIMPCAE